MDIPIPTDDGRWVSENFERLQRVIQDYDHNLVLQWIPPEHRAPGDIPYRIWDTKHHAVVFHASEKDTPQDILARLFEADNAHHNVMTRMQSANAAAKALQLKEQADLYEQMADEARFLKNSELHTVRMNGKKFDHERRRIG